MLLPHASETPSGKLRHGLLVICRAKLAIPAQCLPAKGDSSTSHMDLTSQSPLHGTSLHSIHGLHTCLHLPCVACICTMVAAGSLAQQSCTQALLSMSAVLTHSKVWHRHAIASPAHAILLDHGGRSLLMQADGFRPPIMGGRDRKISHRYSNSARRRASEPQTLCPQHWSSQPAETPLFNPPSAAYPQQHQSAAAEPDAQHHGNADNRQAQ